MFLYLDFKDLCKVSQVCKMWHLASDHDTCWALLCEARGWKEKSSQSITSSYITRTSIRSIDNTPWKNLFRNRYLIQKEKFQNPVTSTNPKKEEESNFSENASKKQRGRPRKDAVSKSRKRKMAVDNEDGEWEAVPKKSVSKKKKTSKVETPEKEIVKEAIVSEITRERTRSLLLLTLQQDSELDTQICLQLSHEIEEGMYAEYHSKDRLYRSKYRSLSFNLKKQKGLRDKLFSGEINPVSLCQMTHQELSKD